MKPVLIAYASRLGSTPEIASAIGDQLASRGFEVEVSFSVEAARARGFGAVLLGSAVYMGQWDKRAVDYLRRGATDLAQRSTWLFQTRPAGSVAATGRTGTPRAVKRLCRTIGLAEPTTFAANLDDPDWDEIRAWADGIADQLIDIPAATGS